MREKPEPSTLITASCISTDGVGAGDAGGTVVTGEVLDGVPDLEGEGLFDVGAGTDVCKALVEGGLGLTVCVTDTMAAGAGVLWKRSVNTFMKIKTPDTKSTINPRIIPVIILELVFISVIVPAATGICIHHRHLGRVKQVFAGQLIRKTGSINKKAFPWMMS